MRGRVWEFFSLQASIFWGFIHVCRFLVVVFVHADTYRRLAVAEDGLSAVVLCNGPHLYLWSPFFHASLVGLASPSSFASSPSSSSSSSAPIATAGDADEVRAAAALGAQPQFRAWLPVPVDRFVLDNQR